MTSTNKPLGLTDRQLAAIKRAAKRLPGSERAEFLQAVAAHLGAEPTDSAVEIAIDAELALNRLPAFVGSK